MSKIILTILVLLVNLMVSAQSVKLKSVFNGENFKKWELPKDNVWWSVKDGIVQGKSVSKKKGPILWTKKEYTDFVFETEFLFGKGIVDSGILLHSSKHEIQIGVSGSKKRDMTGSPYIPGKGYLVEATKVKELLKLNDWNVIKVKAVKNVYTVWVNNVQVLNYQSSETPKKGSIGLQLPLNINTKIFYKNLKIGKL